MRAGHLSGGPRSLTNKRPFVLKSRACRLSPRAIVSGLISLLPPSQPRYNQVVTRQLEAVFVGGVLRPLEPPPLTENQHILVTISDVPGPATPPNRAEEMKWLGEHGDEFRGQWLALRSSELLSSGPRALVVREEARQKGCPRPLNI